MSNKKMIFNGLMILVATTVFSIVQGSVSTYSVRVVPSGTPALALPQQGFKDDVKERIIIAEEIARKVSSIQNGVRLTLAGSDVAYAVEKSGVEGPATSAVFKGLSGVWGDSVGNVFICDRGGFLIRKVDSDGIITNFAGSGLYGSDSSGIATSAKLNRPVQLAGDTEGNVYFSSSGNIGKVSRSGILSVVAGGGESLLLDAVAATSVFLFYPGSVFFNSNDGNIFFTASGFNKVAMVNKVTQLVTTIAGGGNNPSTFTGVSSQLAKFDNPVGIFIDESEDIFVTEQSTRHAVVKITKESEYQMVYLIAGGPGATTVVNSPISVFGSARGKELFVVTGGAIGSINALVEDVPTAAPTVSPSASPTVKPTPTPTEAPTFAVPEYSLTISAKSFKYFEVKVFTEANERLFPVSYDLVDCPENAEAVIWGHPSTPITEDTNTCVYGLSRHYWCECPALVNNNKPKLTLNFGGTVFDRVELLILDWVDGEVVVSDSANNIVLFSASRAGGPLAGEEFVGYDHLNLLQVAPSVVPTMAPSSVPTTIPSWTPTTRPSIPSVVPTQTPTVVPTTTEPTAEPSVTPSVMPSAAPSFTAQYTITLSAKTFKYFEVRVYTHDNLRIFPVSYELEHCPENAGIAVWNEQTTEDTNTCVYGYPRNFWCQCAAAAAGAKPKLVLHMGHTVFDRVELLLLNWEDGEVTVSDEANHETFLSATHDGVGNEFVTFGNLNLQHTALAPAGRRLLRGA